MSQRGYFLLLLGLGMNLFAQDRLPAVADFIWVDSEPSGAEVEFGGKKLGKTPLVIPALKEGKHSVTLRKPGYQQATEEFPVPNDGKKVVVRLEGEAGTCLVESDPSGASVYHGTQLLGRTPLLLPRNYFAEGEQPIRISKIGYDSLKIKLDVKADEPCHTKVALQAQTGSLRLTIVPSSAELVLGGTNYGSLLAVSPATRRSKEIVLDGLIAGKHQVKLLYAGQSTEGELIKIEASKESQGQFIFWFPDTRIVLADGRSHDVMIVEKSDIEYLVVTSRHKLKKLAVAKIKSQAAIPQEEAANLVRTERIRRIMRKKSKSK